MHSPQELAHNKSADILRQGRGFAAGFTLIELMIVVVIVAVLAALALPAFQDMIAKNKVKAAAEEIYGLVLQGKSEGPIRDRNIDFTVENSNSTNWCIGYVTNTAGSGTLNSCSCDDAAMADVTCRVNVAGTDVAQVVRAEYHPDVIVTGSNFGFSLPRQTAAGAGTLEIINGDWQLDVVVSAQGRIKLCNPNSNAMPGYEEC